MRRRSVVVPMLVVWVLAVALATIVPAVPARADAPARPLPPADREAIAAIFDPLLEPLGLRTTRAALQSTKTFQRDRDGRHLAVYVEPTGAYTDAQFVDGFAEVARVYLPRVFERWKRLASFDVCQEPLPAEDDQLAPPPMTQIFIDRRTSRGIDWADATLADMLDVLLASDDDFSTAYFDPRLEDEPALVAAMPTSATGTYER